MLELLQFCQREKLDASAFQLRLFHLKLSSSTFILFKIILEYFYSI